MLKVAGQTVGNVKDSADLLDNAKRIGGDEDLVMLDEMGRVATLFDGSPMDPEEWLFPTENPMSEQQAEQVRSVRARLTTDQVKILDAYAEHGSVRKAAEILGMKPATFGRKLKQARDLFAEPIRLVSSTPSWRCRGCDLKIQAFTDMSGLPHPGCDGDFVSAGKAA
jgi:hypothetical protein